MDPEVRKLRAVIRDLGGSLGSWSHELTKYGYDRLGNGSFAQVVRYPGDPTKVIKIGSDMRDGYLPFATYAFLNPAPCFPKIYSMHMEEQFFMVVMERLEGYEARKFGDDYSSLRNTDPAVLRMEEVLGPMDDFDSRNCMVRVSDGSQQLVVTDGYYRTSRNKKDYYPVPCGDECALEERRRVLNGPALSTRPSPYFTSDPVRPAKEGEALRFDPLAFDNLELKRVERVLPSLPDRVLARKIGQRGPYRIAAKGPNLQEFKRARYLVEEHRRVVGRRADMLVVDDVAFARRNFADVEKRLLMEMAWAIGPGGFAARTDHFARGPAAPSTTPKPEPEVPNQAPKPRKPDVRVQDRPGFVPRGDWWRRQDKLPRGLRGNGGCA